MFVLGIIVGLLIAILSILTLTYFRAGIEQRVKVIQTTISENAPKLKGSIHFPDDDKTLARQEIIAKNRAEGRPTRLDELI